MKISWVKLLVGEGTANRTAGTIEAGLEDVPPTTIVRGCTPDELEPRWAINRCILIRAGID